MKIIRNSKIEDLAEQRLVEFRTITGKDVSPPVAIQHFGEQVLKLDFCWDSIEELPGETIFGGLNKDERLVVLNEKRRQLFEEKPGLLRFTIGHELGHWDLFVDHSNSSQPILFEAENSGAFALRSSGVGDVVVIKRLLEEKDGWDLYRALQKRGDEPDEARAVNRYSAAVLMPATLLRNDALLLDRTLLRTIYHLAERYDVTPTAMKVRLQQLGLLHIGKDGELLASQDKAVGQSTFGFVE